MTITQPFPFGGVAIIRTTGAPSYYLPSGNTNAARGEALYNARLTAVAGDTIRLNPGSYDISDYGQQVLLADSVNLEILPGATILSNADLTTAGCIVRPGNNSIIYGGGAVTGNAVAGTYQAPIGIVGGVGDVGKTGIVVANITMTADTDAFYFQSQSAACGAILRACTMITKWDAIVAAGSTGVVQTIDCYDCRVVITGPTSMGAAQSRGVYASFSSTIRYFGGSISVASGGANGSDGLHVTNGGVVEAYGTKITVTNGASPKFDANIVSGTIRVAACSGSDTNGLLLTSGSVTYVGPENAANIATGNLAVARIATALTTPGAIGSATPNTGAFTTLSATGAVTFSGQLSASAPIFVGGVLTNSVDSWVTTNRSLTGTGNGHAFSASDIVNRTGGTDAYAAFDARFTVIGTANYDHFVGFQSSPTIGTSGTTNAHYNIYTSAIVNTGTVSSLYGLYIADATGTGTVGTNYGIKITALTKGTTDYAIYVENNNCLFNGQIQIGDTTPGYISGNTGTINLTAAGTNKSITLTPSGSGNVTVSGTPLEVNGGYLFSDRISTPGFVINTSGTHYGNIYQASASSFALGYSVSKTTNGAAALTWTNTGDVTVAKRLSTTPQTTTLAAAVTTVAVTANMLILTGDAGGNTLATITGGVAGMELTILFRDALVTISNNDVAATANSVDLEGAANFVSSAGDTLKLVHDGTKFFEVSRSVN